MSIVLCVNKDEAIRSAVERVAAEKRKRGRSNLGRLVKIRMKRERDRENG